MGKRRHIFRVMLAAMALLVAVSAWGLVGAKDEPTQPPFLGIGLNPDETGVVISEVLPDSPAAEAGLEVGDIVTAIDGTDVTAENIREALAEYAVGDTVQLDVQRGDETLQLSATLAEHPAARQNFEFQLPEFVGRPMLGVSLEDGENGAVIREVVSDSPAEAAGLQVDDVITSINDTQIANAQDAVDAISDFEAGDTITLTVTRGDETLTIEATLERAPAFQIPFLRSLGFTYNPADKTWTVNELSEDSPLYEAGLRSGDIIQEFDGEAYDPMALNEFVNGLADDATVTLTIEHDGESQDITVPATALDEINMFGFGGTGSFQFPFEMGQLMGGARLGVQFMTLDEETAEERDVTQTEGALVTEVVEDSPAAEAGLQVNDIITAVNGEPVDAERTLRDRIAAYEPDDQVTLDVIRGDETLQIEVTLGQAEMGQIFPFGNGGFQLFGQDGLPFQFQLPDPAPFDGQPQTQL